MIMSVYLEELFAKYIAHIEIMLTTMNLLMILILHIKLLKKNQTNTPFLSKFIQN